MAGDLAHARAVAELNMLAHLPDDRMVSTKALADALHLKCSPVVATLSRAAKKQWVIRVKTGTYNMFWMWRLTDEGIASLAAAKSVSA